MTRAARLSAFGSRGASEVTDASVVESVVVWRAFQSHDTVAAMATIVFFGLLALFTAVWSIGVILAVRRWGARGWLFVLMAPLIPVACLGAGAVISIATCAVGRCAGG